VTLAAAAPALVAVHLLAATTWVGGFVAIGVVAQVARRTLDPAARIAFFRTLGRTYGVVGGLSLLVALGTGAALLPEPLSAPRDLAAIALGAALLLATATGVRQARAMTRLRMRALHETEASQLARALRLATLAATLLRASIGLLTLALLGLAALIAA
jgi:putative copper export protein